MSSICSRNEWDLMCSQFHENEFGLMFVLRLCFPLLSEVVGFFRKKGEKTKGEICDDGQTEQRHHPIVVVDLNGNKIHH